MAAQLKSSRVLQVLFFVGSLLLTSLSFAASDLGQSLSSVVSVNVNYRPSPPSKVTIGNATVTNISASPDGKNVYDGLILVLNGISDPTVTLTNFTGFAADGRPYIVVPRTLPFFPRQTIRNIRLVFNNPNSSEFTADFEPYGTTAPVSVDATQPGPFASGSEAVLTGQNFTVASSVTLAGLKVQVTEVTSNYIRFLVPFRTVKATRYSPRMGNPAQSSLVPLAAGSYEVRINGRRRGALSIEDLPVNPNPPGQVLSDTITSLNENLTTAIASYKANLPQLRVAYSDNPNALELLNTLESLGDEIAAHPELTASLSSKIDPRSLDTLERSLVRELGSIAPPPAGIAPALAKAASSGASHSACTMADGNAWLECRKTRNKADKEASDTIDKIGKVTTAVCFVATIATTGGTATALCGVLNSQIALFQALMEMDMASREGVIKSMNLIIAPSFLSFPVGSVGHIDLTVNNFDNNPDIPTTNQAKILGARILVDKKPSLVSIGAIKVLLAVIDVALIKMKSPIPATKIIDTASDPWKKFMDLLSQLKKNIQTEEKYLTSRDKTIGSDVQEYEISYSYVQPRGIGTGCRVVVGKYTYVMVRDDGSIAVPDSSPYYDWPLRVGKCDFKVKDSFTIETESGVNKEVQFVVVKYPALKLAVGTGGSVTYGQPSMAGASGCADSMVCNEHFDRSDILLTGVPAKAGASARWDGDTHSYETHLVKLDPQNIPVPSTTVAFTDCPGDSSPWLPSGPFPAVRLKPCASLIAGAQVPITSLIDVYFGDAISAQIQIRNTEGIVVTGGVEGPSYWGGCALGTYLCYDWPSWGGMSIGVPSSFTGSTVNIIFGVDFLLIRPTPYDWPDRMRCDDNTAPPPDSSIIPGWYCQGWLGPWSGGVPVNVIRP